MARISLNSWRRYLPVRINNSANNLPFLAKLHLYFVVLSVFLFPVFLLFVMHVPTPTKRCLAKKIAACPVQEISSCKMEIPVTLQKQLLNYQHSIQRSSFRISRAMF